MTPETDNVGYIGTTPAMIASVWILYLFDKVLLRSCWKSVLNFGDTSGKVILFQLKHLVFQADMQILLQLTRAIVICEPLPNCSGSRQPKLPSCTLTLQVFMRSVLGPRIIIRITSFLGEISCDQIASGKPENPWRLV